MCSWAGEASRHVKCPPQWVSASAWAETAFRFPFFFRFPLFPLSFFHISILVFFSFLFFYFPPFSPYHQSLLSHHPLSQLSLASLPLLCLLCVSPPFVSLPLLYLPPFRRHTGAIGCIPRFRFRNSNEWTLTAFPSPPSLRLILCKYFVAQLHNKREALPLAKNTNLITSFTIYTHEI